MKRNIGSSMVISLIYGLIGVALWGAVSYFLDLRLGLVGLLIGFMVGKAMSKSNNRENVSSGVIAVIITVLTILVGEYLSLVLLLAKEVDLSITESLKILDFSTAWSILTESLGAKSYIIYFLSVFEAYKIGSSVSVATTKEASETSDIPDIV